MNLSDCVHAGKLLFKNKLSTFFSSTLLKLHINLEALNDCFHLLDGRFSQLRVLYINIDFICPPSIINSNREELSNLRCFSLNCCIEVPFYDELIVPLHRRMVNLENLTLYLALDPVDPADKFVDGNDLKKNIINYMPRLNEFLFNIRSTIRLNNEISLFSNNDIQRTFINFPDNQILSYVDYFPKTKHGQCHIYSYPYTLSYYDNISNNFPGGLFECVREISLFDERPFEHEFFVRISQAFPFINKLSLSNRKVQKLKNNNANYPIIKYVHLNDLELHDVHKDYLELFLDHTKTILPNKTVLSTDYYSLKKVTDNFKREAMRVRLRSDGVG